MRMNRGLSVTDCYQLWCGVSERKPIFEMRRSPQARLNRFLACCWESVSEPAETARGIASGLGLQRIEATRRSAASVARRVSTPALRETPRCRMPFGRLPRPMMDAPAVSAHENEFPESIAQQRSPVEDHGNRERAYGRLGRPAERSTGCGRTGCREDRRRLQ